MFDLVRLIYNSKANFDWTPSSVGLQPEVAEILKQARQFNRSVHITGVLFFADGFFFQCLEGRREKVLSLAEKIEKDSRHTDFKISFCRTARRRKFRDWSMKFVPVESEVRDHIRDQGHQDFRPDKYTESEINSLVELFTRMNDTSLVDAELRQSHRSKPGFWRRLFTIGASESA